MVPEPRPVTKIRSHKKGNVAQALEIERLTAQAEDSRQMAIRYQDARDAALSVHDSHVTTIDDLRVANERLRGLLRETEEVCDVEHGAPALFARIDAALARTKEETDGTA